MINREIMTKNPVCCLPVDTIKKAAELMKVGDFGALPIVDSEENRKIVGILTDRDIAVQAVAEGMDPETTKVERVMNRNVFCVRDTDDVNETLSTMSNQQIRRIPVVDADDRIVGIVAQADIATRLDDTAEAGKVVEEISRSNSNVVSQVATKKNLSLVGLAIVIVIAILIVLNLLDVIKIF